MKIPSARRSSRGYTLIELILVLGLLGIVLSTIGLMVRQGYQLHYIQLDRLEAHQNGRIALDFLKKHLREAAWGSSNGLNHRGTIAVGGCFDDALNDSQVCNNVDDGNDRIRIYRGLAEPHVFRESHNSKDGGLGIAVGASAGADPMAAVSLGGQLGMISGKCADQSGIFGTSAVVITGDSAGGGFHHRFSVSSYGGGGTQLACPAGFTDFRFGKAQAIDFFIDKTDEVRGPVLRIRYNAGLGDDDASENGVEIAGGIEGLQIQYGIDTSDPPDNIANKWCNDPFAVLSECNHGFGEEESLARVIAARVQIVARNVTQRVSFTGDVDRQLPIQDYTIEDLDDGYQRYVYQATVALRNKRL